MLILIHVLIAVSGLLISGFGLIKPSRLGLKLAWALVGLTFLSGFLLILTKQAHLMQTCLSGLTYLAFVLPLLVFSHRRLRLAVDQSNSLKN